MTLRLKSWMILATMLIASPALDGLADELRGVVFTERPVAAITVQVWALGDRLLDDSASFEQPLAVARAAHGAPFAISQGDCTESCEVEISAPGHVSVGLRFATGVAEGVVELPAAWLPEGLKVPLTVLRQDRPVPDATVSGRMETAMPALDPDQRWRPVVARTQTDMRGNARVVMPVDRPLVLDVVSRDGAWDRFSAKAGSLAILELTSLPLRLTLTDAEGSPVAGAFVADMEAPLGSTAVTDENGTAMVQVQPRSSWAIAARAGRRWGRWVSHEPSPSSWSVTLGGVEDDVPRSGDIRVEWSSSEEVLLSPPWLPAALLGGAPIVGHGGEAWLGSPSGFPTGPPRKLLARSRSGGVAAVNVGSDQTNVALALGHPVELRGRVTFANGKAARGVPIWLRYSESTGSAPSPLLPQAVSGDAGGFAIAHLPAERFHLEALEAGFIPAASPWLAVHQLPAGEVVLVLRTGADLRFRAVDTSGRPALGVTATLRPKTDLRSRISAPLSPTSEAVASAAGDTEGRFSLTELRVGRYDLRLEAPDLAARSVDVQLAAGGTDLGDLVLEPATRLEGWVVDTSGYGIAGVTVRATLGPPLGEQDLTFEATSRDGGAFTLAGVPSSGNLHLDARGDGVRTLAPVRIPLPPAGNVEIEVQTARVMLGRALAATRGQPIEGAIVLAELAGSEHLAATLDPPISDTSVTDEEGVFELRLFPGDYQARAEAAAYQPRELAVVIDVGREPEPVTIELTRGERLRGRVITEAGRPVQDAEVQAVAADGDGPSHQRRSTADGIFELDQLGAGPYQITADGGDQGTARRVVDVPSPEDVVLRLEPAAAISGRVIAADGSVPAAGEVHVRSHHPGRARLAPRPLDSDGRFHFTGLSAGDHTLRAAAAGWATARREVHVAAGERVEVVLELDGGGAVKGLVRGLEAQDLARCQILGGGTATLPATDGSFVLEDVALGRQTITAMISPGGPERSTEVELVAVGDIAEVELDFDSGLRLSGTVSDRRGPMAGAWVVLRASSSTQATQELTDGQGSFELRAGAPGPATLSVVDRRGRLLLTEHVELTGDLNLDLTIEDLNLRGQVVATDSEAPIPMARVHLQAVDGQQVERATTADGSGRFELTDLGAGAYGVRAEASGYGAATEEVLLDESTTAEVQLRLPPADGVSIRVVEASGQVPQTITVHMLRNGWLQPPIALVPDPTGRARFDDLAPGDVTALVQGSGAAIVALAVPGPEVTATLRPTGRLMVGGAREDLMVRIVDGNLGAAVPLPSWASPSLGEWALLPSHGLSLALPEGDYRLEVSDGRDVLRELPIAVAAGRVSSVDPGSSD